MQSSILHATPAVECPRPFSRSRALLLSAVAATLLAHGGISLARNPSEPVSLNFQNADIETVIGAIGRITGQNFLIDPRVKGKLNIITNTPVAPELSYQILLSALRLQGFTAVEGEAWEAWEDGKRVEAADFFVPFGRSFDVAEAGANALGVEVSESLNVKKK